MVVLAAVVEPMSVVEGEARNQPARRGVGSQHLPPSIDADGPRYAHVAAARLSKRNFPASVRAVMVIVRGDSWGGDV